MEKAFFFSNYVLNWHHANPRPLPWTRINDPYKIWLSEIILQQTQVAQGRDYYLRFIKRFPTVCSLAEAQEDEVLHLWQGLGYYSRARNLHRTARHICHELSGQFPQSAKELIKLKGIGPYTSAAIASFAFGERIAVVDGNVYRLLARYFGLHVPINTPSAYKLFYQQAMQCLSSHDPAEFNQAMMNFGSLICKPRTPLCPGCTLKSHCYAYLHNEVMSLPIKKKPNARRERHFNYVIVKYKGQILLSKRLLKDIWQHLYEFLLIETDHACSLEYIETELQQLFGNNSSSLTPVARTKSILSHQTLFLRLYSIDLQEKPTSLAPNSLFIPFSELKNYSFPQPLNSFLKKKSLI